MDHHADWFSTPQLGWLVVTLPQRTRKGTPLEVGDIVGNHTTGANPSSKCAFRWIAGVNAFMSINGGAVDGKHLQKIDGDAGAVASVFCHELGHLMGLTPFINSVAAQTQCGSAPGMPVPQHVDDLTMPRQGWNYLDCEVFGGGAPPGNGLRNIHQGAHCAHGLDEARLVDPFLSLRPPAGPPAPPPILRGNCIMFGESDLNVDGMPSYCPACLKVLKSRNLTSIRVNWPANRAHV